MSSKQNDPQPDILHTKIIVNVGGVIIKRNGKHMVVVSKAIKEVEKIDEVVYKGQGSNYRTLQEFGKERMLERNTAFTADILINGTF